ncbi:MAG: hypothetical protein V9G19_13600 [Tetrasphaera sp.]
MFGPAKARRDAEFTAFVEAAQTPLLRMAYALTVTSFDTPEGGQTGFFAMLVDAGAARPKLTSAPILTWSDDPQIAPIPGTDHAVLWTEVGTTKPGRPFDRISWERPDGRRVTVTNH